MDESDIDSDDDDDDDDQSLITEEEEVTVNAEAIEERDLQLRSLLQRKNELPLRTRNKLKVLVFELLTKTKDDIHEMICDNKNSDEDDADYRGFDSSRDTQKLKWKRSYDFSLKSFHPQKYKSMVKTKTATN
eukprot:CAMPEP_0171008876 /NCGR_PEP_ID=MMETSP0736-20130129/20899_1 /TAXON_ID=186038 /ORGANISM="Fragilariopsis kerguelensis, Strain L26-C5" /LENGTH=131 /DNA_ID=CAMNT_0011440207 /DNA_START=624 /DNA_END=1019 /DNA_ORIENTATION=+